MRVERITGGPRAIVLSAGQGRRLLPLTEQRPKCAVPVNGRTLIEWQVDALHAAGIVDVTAVVGFGAELVEGLLARRYPGRRVQTLFNPFFRVADNLASCWAAREAMDSDFILLNGDTVFEPALLSRLLDSKPAPITLAVDHKPAYDDDDMKVQLDGDRLLRVGKTLPAPLVNGESIGMLYFRGDGARRFRAAVETALRKPEALRHWYLSVIDALAAGGAVHACSIAGLRWAEMDFPHDLARVQAVVADADAVGVAPFDLDREPLAASAG